MIAGSIGSRYTPDELSDQADVEFISLPDEQQEAAVESVLESELETVQEHESEFKQALNDDVLPTDSERLRLTCGDETLWNSASIRDRLFLYDDSFSVQGYRATVNGV